jgi:hypothetical protein
VVADLGERMLGEMLDPLRIDRLPAGKRRIPLAAFAWEVGCGQLGFNHVLLRSEKTSLATPRAKGRAQRQEHRWDMLMRLLLNIAAASGE